MTAMTPFIGDGALHLPAWETSIALPPIVDRAPRPLRDDALFGIAVKVGRTYDGLGPTGAAILLPTGWGVRFRAPASDGEGIVDRLSVFWVPREPDAQGRRMWIFEEVVPMTADLSAFPALLRTLSERESPGGAA